MAQCLVYHRNGKRSPHQLPHRSHHTETARVGPAQVQVLVTAEWNLGSLTIWRKKSQIYCFNYMCSFTIAVLYGKQSKWGIIEWLLCLCLQFDNPKFNTNTTSTIYFQLKIKAKISICLKAAHWRFSLPMPFCLWLANLAFPWNSHCFKSHPLGTLLPFTSNPCLFASTPLLYHFLEFSGRLCPELSPVVFNTRKLFLALSTKADHLIAPNHSSLP